MYVSGGGYACRGGISREGGEYITIPDTWDLGYYGIQLASEWYASYWNAFLF